MYCPTFLDLLYSTAKEAVGRKVGVQYYYFYLFPFLYVFVDISIEEVSYSTEVFIALARVLLFIASDQGIVEPVATPVE